MPKITRNFYISLAIGVCILFVGGSLFGDSEGGMFVVEVAMFGVGIGLLEVLESRERHRRQGHD